MKRRMMVTKVTMMKLSPKLQEKSAFKDISGEASTAPRISPFAFPATAAYALLFWQTVTSGIGPGTHCRVSDTDSIFWQGPAIAGENPVPGALQLTWALSYMGRDPLEPADTLSGASKHRATFCVSSGITCKQLYLVLDKHVVYK